MLFKCDETGFKFDLFLSKPLILSWNLSLNPCVGSTIKELQATFYGRMSTEEKEFLFLSCGTLTFVGLLALWWGWIVVPEIWVRPGHVFLSFFLFFSYYFFYFSFLFPFPWLFVHLFLMFAHFLNFVRVSETRIFSTSLHIFSTVISLQK